ncbi:MAG: sigma-54-dependent transcriptional regulator [Phycisphaerales bacterium]
MPRVLIIDDDPLVLATLAETLVAHGHAIVVASDAQASLDMLAKGEPFDAAICDLALPGTSGMELLPQLQQSQPGMPVILISGYGTIESAVRALRLGAADFLAKPISDARLIESLNSALSRAALGRPARRGVTRHSDGLEAIIGSDPRMLRTLELVRAVAPSRTTVLMTGESGTGKSLVAHAIHRASPRHAKPFVEVSCGSIPETLLESELFGHVKGAFTGAHADKVGRFLAANGGTLFLDEINSASAAMQLKLLRVLQERRFEPVGSTQTVEVDVRVVLASNQPLEGLVAQGIFRQDLYYRINVVGITIPPLRERLADVPTLAAHFLAFHSAELAKQVVGFAPEALAALCRYDYPGNVRELQNIIERAAVLTRSPTITLADLPDLGAGKRAAPTQAAASDEPWVPTPLEDALREPERRILLRALVANNWNRQRTADQLRINRTTLYKKMKSLGIEGDEQDAA